MALPTKQGFFNKFLSAIVEDRELARAYFERFGIAYLEKTPEEIRWQLVDKLSNYGGYEVRRRLIECVEIRPWDCVLDIGPETGMECFLLAEVYRKVLVAEPDATTPYLLRELAEYYYTDDGRKASDVLDIQRAGIIPPNSTFLKVIRNTKASGLVEFDARGALDIHEVFGLNFADRIVCHHIGALMPAEPKLLLLLSALSLALKSNGVITWCDELSELSGLVVDYAKYRNPLIQRKKYYKYYGCVTECSIREIKNCIIELLPEFSVTFRVFWKTGQLLTIARHC